MASIAGHAGGDISVALDQKSVEDMIKKLKNFEKKVGKKIIRTAVKEGATTIKESIKANAPTDTGLLKRNIAVKTRVAKGGKGIYSIIGAKWLEQNKNPAIYIHVLETGGKKLSAGTRPFAKDAFNKAATSARADVIQSMKRGIRELRGKL